MSVIGPCCENECNTESENCQLEMFNEVGDDRVDGDESDIGEDESGCQSDTSGEPEGLTDSSSEDDSITPGGHVWRTFNGVRKLRRVRSIRHRPHGIAPTSAQLSELPMPLRRCGPSDCGSSCHDSDEDCIDDLFPDDDVIDSRGTSGSSYAEITEPNTQNKRTSISPSRMEETAMLITEMMNSNKDSCSGHQSVSSVSELTPTQSCLGRICATPLRMAQLAETRDTADTGISLLQEVRRSGFSAVNNPDDWIAIDVTVDSGACITVMPPGLCPGIRIMENDLSRGRGIRSGKR